MTCGLARVEKLLDGNGEVGSPRHWGPSRIWNRVAGFRTTLAVLAFAPLGAGISGCSAKDTETVGVVRSAVGETTTLTFRITGVKTGLGAPDENLASIELETNWDEPPNPGAVTPSRIFQCGDAIAVPCALNSEGEFHPYPEFLQENQNAGVLGFVLSEQRYIKTETVSLDDPSTTLEVDFDLDANFIQGVQTPGNFALNIDLATGTFEPSPNHFGVCGFRHNGNELGECAPTHDCITPNQRPECSQECVFFYGGWELCYELDIPCVRERAGNGIDDDCDSVIDECEAGETQICQATIPTVASAPPECVGVVSSHCISEQDGRLQCDANGIPGACIPNSKDTVPEIKNCLDDDCDGVVDECNPGQLEMDCMVPTANPDCGVCDSSGSCVAPGKATCSGGVPGPCVPIVTSLSCTVAFRGCDHAPGTEACDGPTAGMCIPNAIATPEACPLPGCAGGNGDSNGNGDPDDDRDGLLDCWEVHGGINVDGDPALEISLPGANPLHKDVFVEIDFMTGHRPNQKALDDVVDAFRRGATPNPDGINGVTLHLVVDDEIPHHSRVHFDSCGIFGSGIACDAPKFNDLKEAHFGTQVALDAKTRHYRQLAFRYVIFAHSDGGSSVGGKGELPGNDFIVYGGGSSPTHPDVGVFAGVPCGDDNRCRPEQSHKLMHELGHNLGLGHGGGESKNCKPNYPSIMNYMYAYRAPNGLDYSRGQLPALNQEALIEPFGLGPNPATRSVRFGPALPRCPSVPPAGGNVCENEGHRCDYWCAVDAMGMPLPGEFQRFLGCANGTWQEVRQPCGSLRPWPPANEWVPAIGPINWNRNVDVALNFLPLIESIPVTADIADVSGDSCSSSVDDPVHFDHNDWAGLRLEPTHENHIDNVRIDVPDEPSTDEDFSRDEDHDGVPDIADNCVYLPNPQQSDVNGDGIGEGCEIQPIAECVDSLPGGALRAAFGYSNLYRGNVRILPGPTNGFSPGPHERGQIRDLGPGRHRAAFEVEFTAPSLTWLLGNRQATASLQAGLPTCSGDDDGDGIVNRDDNCRLAANADQGDEDQDGVGNACSTQCFSDSGCPTGQHCESRACIPVGCVVPTDCSTGSCLNGVCTPAEFNPAHLQPLAWYEASAATVTSTGTGVSEWRDSSGNGHHLTQTESGLRPSYSATSWNGSSPSVTFDGSNDFLEYPASGGALLNELAGNDQPFTVLLSWEPLDLDSDYDLMQWDNGGVNGGNSLIELRTNATGGDEARYRVRRGDGISNVFNTGTPKFVPARRTTGFVFTGVALSIYDGDAVHLNGGASNLDPLVLVRYRLGHGDNTPLNGRIAEVVITNWALSESEYQRYRNYAKSRWGGM